MNSQTWDEFGCYRVVEPPGSLPQNCWRIDNDPTPRKGETRVDVEVLNIDSSSFRQLEEQSQKEGRPLSELILAIVNERGKMHNPVTGSGGVLLGTTDDGRRIASLISLSLTPLKIDEILSIDNSSERVYIRGTAILFERTLYAEIPADLPEAVSLAVMDVAGAPARVAEICRQKEQILIMGAGKAGLLSAAAVRRENRQAEILAVDVAAAPLEDMSTLKLCDSWKVLDGRSPLAFFDGIREATARRLCDLTINVVNQPNTEGASILATRDGGTIYFFSMATSFSQAALTAEGLARDVEMLVGSGYTRGWTDYAFKLIREDPALLAHFEKRYGV